MTADGARPDVTVIRPGMKLRGWRPVFEGGRFFQEFTFEGAGSRSVTLLIDDEVMHTEGISVRPRGWIEVDGSPGDLFDPSEVPSRAPESEPESLPQFPPRWLSILRGQVTTRPGAWTLMRAASALQPNQASAGQVKAVLTALVAEGVLRYEADRAHWVLDMDLTDPAGGDL